MTDYTARNVLLKDANGNYLIPYTEKADLSLSNLNASGKAYVAIKGYDSTATYSLNEVVMTIVSGSVLFYKSLVNNNTSALSDTTKWEAVSFGGGSPAWGNITGTLSNQTDLQNVLDGKADIDASNFNAAGKSLLSGFGAPSNTYESLTLLASGQTYTAPGTGYIVVNGVSKTTTAYVDLTNRGTTDSLDINHSFSGFNAVGYWCSATVPVKKDDIVRLRYGGMQLSGDLYPLAIRYVKAVGEV